MSEAMEDLARQAVACPAFRPMRGMVGVDGEVITYERRYGDSWHVTTSEMVQEYHCGVRYDEPWQGSFDDLLRKGGWLPNFDQPATRGCLLALVREVLSEPLAGVEVRQSGNGYRAILRVPTGSEGWRVVGRQWWRASECPASQCPATAEAAVLITALEVASHAMEEW
jgi:hypothetical protein